MIKHKTSDLVLNDLWGEKKSRRKNPAMGWDGRRNIPRGSWRLAFVLCKSVEFSNLYSEMTKGLLDKLFQKVRFKN